MLNIQAYIHIKKNQKIIKIILCQRRYLKTTFLRYKCKNPRNEIVMKHANTSEIGLQFCEDINFLINCITKQARGFQFNLGVSCFQSWFRVKSFIDKNINEVFWENINSPIALNVLVHL
jgi:hypothetical protein